MPDLAGKGSALTPRSVFLQWYHERMVELGRVELARPERGVHEKEGKWYMRYDGKSDGAEIPRDMASIIKAALWMEGQRRMPKMSQALDNIDCHQTAFFCIGLLRPEKMQEKYAYDVSLFTGDEYKKAESVEVLTEYLRGVLGNRLGIVQIAPKGSLPSDGSSFELNPSHSFLAGPDLLGRMICFEKRDSGSIFQIVPLDSVYARYFHEHLWAAKPVEEVEDSPGAEHARKVIELNERVRSEL